MVVRQGDTSLGEFLDREFTSIACNIDKKTNCGIVIIAPKDSNGTEEEKSSIIACLRFELDRAIKNWT